MKPAYLISQTRGSLSWSCMVFHNITTRLDRGCRKLSAAFIGSQRSPEKRQPLCDLSFLSDKIMERLPHSALMPTLTAVPKASGPTPACSQDLTDQPCCMDSLRSPWLGGSKGLIHSTEAGRLPAPLLLSAQGCPSVPPASSPPLLSSVLQALTQELQRELLWS